MIDVLAEAHGQSKRTIENEYTLWDYHIYVLRKNLESARQQSEIDKNK